jgi:hypothetical protein
MVGLTPVVSFPSLRDHHHQFTLAKKKNFSLSLFDSFVKCQPVLHYFLVGWRWFVGRQRNVSGFVVVAAVAKVVVVVAAVAKVVVVVVWPTSPL